MSEVENEPAARAGIKERDDQGIDPRSLVLSQDFASMVGVRKITLNIPIRRPPPQVFFSPNPDPDARIQIAALDIKEDGETYIVSPELVDELAGEWVPKVLIPSITRQGAAYLWPIRLPGSDGRIDSWNESALRIANEFAGRWIRVTANREIGAYDVIVPAAQYEAPDFPDSEGMLKTAFRDRVIDRPDHPVIRQLKGLV